MCQLPQVAAYLSWSSYLDRGLSLPTMPAKPSYLVYPHNYQGWEKPNFSPPDALGFWF